MTPIDAAELRSLATAVKAACRPIEDVLGRAMDMRPAAVSRSLKLLVSATEGPVGRAKSELERLSERHPSHSRIVRRAREAVERTEKALGGVLAAAEAPQPEHHEDRLAQVVQLEKLVGAALRAAKVIFVEVDGPGAFRAA